MAKACIRAAEYYLSRQSIEPVVIEEFPELTPPRVRFTIAPAIRALSPSDVAIQCEFRSATKPVEIIAFCPDMCLTGATDGYEAKFDPGRFDEIRAILGREGY